MLKIMKKIMVLSLSVALVACAGRTPNPVPIFQPTDDQMSCSEIRAEIEGNQQEMFRLYPKTKKTGKNVALGITGAFFIVPLFFMDFSDAERVEIEAFQRRDQHLHRLAKKKKCGEMPAAIQFKDK
jgi:hypothetical protein